MKKQKFYLKMITSSLMRRRSRMLVALLAVAIGGSILSGLMTIYIDIPRQMGQEFRSYGANMIFIPSNGQSSITDDTIKKAVAHLPKSDVVGIAPYRYETIKINEQPFMVAGTDLTEVKKTSPYWFVSGQWPEHAGAVLIGQEIANIIRFSKGDTFTITGSNARGEGFSKDFTVSGILQTGGTEEAFVFMTIADLEAMQGDSGIYNVVECSISISGEALQSIANQISKEESGVIPQLVKRVTQSEGTVLTKLQALIYLVTVIVLLLTMICVATTMMAVVTERRKEIGLRKALGAANRNIMMEFLGEGVFLGGFGGLIGAGLGFWFAQLVSMNVFNRSITFQPLLIPITFFVSGVVTVLACLIPVWRITDIDPAIVLKGE
ncbi:MAG: ABC transporter permease [Fusobacteriaceae bacterium]|jgi:putative ABC transport system permease protein|nr:ABC transporter permease [Fusobacteriaceae bacterium]